MAEPFPQPAQGDSRDRPAAESATPPPPPRPQPPERAEDGDLIDLPGLNGAEPTDDTPTIISKRGPRPPAPDGISDGLRGRRLAHFELIEPIGVGGMAAVLRARDTQLDRCVALKILPPDMAQDPENVRRFHQEARSAAKLDHENIARVFFCGEDQRLHFIAFEFVEGENLRTLLERRGRLPVAEALHYMLQVAAGLAHAARRGVVHRDIKPSNIIVTPNGRAKLVDMGLARSLGPQADKGLTQSGVTLGTFDYISPEQALEPRDADVRSDIYSLGCTFYHMLTGQPPVPEGTAAKKLHHHQHVRPADPRQLVPELPDEVAVILDRMMAKRPADRYQSPEQLVHHLLLAARKLGASPEVPEGVLSVEAALPNPPRGRPLLLAALAAAAVIGLIFLLDQSPAPTQAPQSRAEGKNQRGEKDRGAGGNEAGPDEPPYADKGGRPDRPPPQPRPVPVYKGPEYTKAELAEWLKKNQGELAIELELARDMDLSPRTGEGDRNEQGLVIKNRKVTIRAAEGGPRPTVRFSYDGLPGKGPRAGLKFDNCQSVTLEGLRFVLDQRFGDTELIGVLFQGGRNHRVTDCEFIQANPTFHSAYRLASVAADAGPRVAAARLDLEGCCFLGFTTAVPRDKPEKLVLERADRGGQDAVVRRGAVAVRATDCAFGPHQAAFRLEGAPSEEEGRVALRRCSVLAARRSAVFDVPAGAAAALDVESALVSRVGDPAAGGMMENDGAVLIRQAQVEPRVTFRGSGNRYHGLDGYWAVSDSREETDWNAFLLKAQADPQDEPSQELAASPWQEKEDHQLKLLEEDRPDEAFRVQARSPELRVGKGAGQRLVGVKQVLGLAVAPSPLPPLGPRPAGAGGRQRVVDPREAESRPGVYASLAAAVLEARPGDVIVIRSNAVLRVDPVQLNKPNLADLTIRPSTGYHPVLVLAAASEKEAALFTVHDGKLRLENLELRLEPGKDGFTSQAVVALAGDGECTLKGCLVTLDKAGRDTPLALAALPEAGKVMRSEAPRARTHDEGPRLALEGCFVRGEGDLVAGRSRAFELEAKNTLAALGGSLLSVDAPAEAPAAAASQKVSVRLSQVTTYLGGALLHLSAGRDLKGVVPVRVEPSRCLFLQAPMGRPLVYLEGSEEKALARKLDWQGGVNGYGGYTSLLEQQPPGEAMMLPPVNREGWKTNYNEASSKFGVELAAPPAAEEPFMQLTPAQFKLPDESAGFGADPDGLPRPAPRGADARRVRPASAEEAGGS
jgi:serine/threonine protein kinase